MASHTRIKGNDNETEIVEMVKCKTGIVYYPHKDISTIKCSSSDLQQLTLNIWIEAITELMNLSILVTKFPF